MNVGMPISFLSNQVWKIWEPGQHFGV